MNKEENRSYYLGLDIMRAIAAILIVVYHYDVHRIEGVSKFTEVFFGTLWSMVDLFFVLSGFLIASGWFKEIEKKGQPSFKDFYIKRFFRILPLYYAVIAFYWIKNVIIMKRVDYNPWNLILFIQNYIGDMGNFSVSWSLAVEEHFYLLFPITSIILLKFIKKKNIIFIWPLFILLITILRYLKAEELYPLMQKMSTKEAHDLFENEIYIPTHLRLDGLLYGIFLASLRVFREDLWNKLKEYKSLLYFVGCTSLISAFWFSEHRYEVLQMSFSFTLMALSFSTLLIPLFHETFDMTKTSSQITAHIAKLSYPIYLLHYPSFYLIDVIFHFLGIKNEQGYLNFIFTMIFIYVLSFLANFIIEEPMLRLRKKFLTSSTRKQS